MELIKRRRFWLVVIIVLLGGGHLASSAWQAPTRVPPECGESGCARPLNIGSALQVKWASLVFGNNLVVDQSTQVIPAAASGVLVSENIGAITPGVDFDIAGSLRIRGGAPALGKVFTALSADGEGYWQNIGAGGIGAPTVNLLVRRSTELNGTPGPLVVSPGTTIVLDWTSSEAVQCQAAGSWSGSNKSTAGSNSFVASQTSVYLLTCTNGNGAATDHVIVNVN